MLIDSFGTDMLEFLTEVVTEKVRRLRIQLTAYEFPLSFNVVLKPCSADYKCSVCKLLIIY